MRSLTRFAFLPPLPSPLPSLSQLQLDGAKGEKRGRKGREGSGRNVLRIGGCLVYSGVYSVLRVWWLSPSNLPSPPSISLHLVLPLVSLAHKVLHSYPLHFNYDHHERVATHHQQQQPHCNGGEGGGGTCGAADHELPTMWAVRPTATVDFLQVPSQWTLGGAAPAGGMARSEEKRRKQQQEAEKKQARRVKITEREAGKQSARQQRQERRRKAQAAHKTQQTGRKVNATDTAAHADAVAASDAADATSDAAEDAADAAADAAAEAAAAAEGDVLPPSRYKGSRLLNVGVSYDVSVILSAPESSVNLDAGMFMVSSTLLEADGRTVLASSARPGVLRYRSWLVEKARTFAFAVPLVLGWMAEQQELELEMFDQYTETYSTPMAKVRVQLSSPQLQLYGAHINFRATLVGVRYYMRHWFLTLAALGIGQVRLELKV